MPLNKSTIPIQFIGGLDQKRPAKLSVLGKFLLLENCIRRKFSLVEKRYGLTAFSKDTFSDTTIANGVGLTTFNDSVIQLDGERIYSYSVANDKWIDKGPCVTASVEIARVSRGSNTQALADFATSDGISVTVWEDSSGGVRYSVFDESTGNTLVNDALVSVTGSRPKVVALRDTFIIGYFDTNLVCKRVARTMPSVLTAATTLVLAPKVAAYWDLDVYTDTAAVFATSMAAQIKVGYVDQNGIVGNPVTNTLPAPVDVGSGTGDACLSVTADPMAERIWIVWADATDANLLALTADLNTNAEGMFYNAAVVRNAAGVVHEDGSFAFFTEVTAASVKNHSVLFSAYTWDGGVAFAGAGFNNAVVANSAGLASKAFLLDDVPYVHIAHESALQPTYFTVRFDGLIVTRILGSVGGGLTRNSTGTLASGLPRVQIGSGGAYETLFQVRNRLQIESGGTSLKSNKGLVKGSVVFGGAIVSRVLGRNLHIGGGTLYTYDGVAASEAGFYLFPEDAVLTTPASGGTALPAEDYSFRIVYEWTDGQGQIHQSAPSITQTVTAALNDNVNLVIPTLRLTNRTASQVKIVIYMAAAGLSTVYYRKGETANSDTVDTVTLVVGSVADVTAPILYTTGGVYENICPPASTAIQVHKNRMWLGGLETDELWYSKEYVVDEAVAFTDFFRMPIEADGGNVTAFASLDDKLIVFKKERCYFQVGEGPIDTGAQNDYGRLQLIAADVGTTIPQSVVETPFGVIFKSSKGFYLLGRSLKVDYVGADVEDFNGLTVTSATLLADENEVRFTTAEGTTLVYNYYFRQWSTFNYGAVSACNGLETYLTLSSDGTVRKEVPNNYEDDGRRYSMAIETSWMSFAGVQGFQRIYELAFLGDFVSHHYTKLKVAYDFENAYTDTKYFNTITGEIAGDEYGTDPFYGDSTVYGGEGVSAYQFRYAPIRQKCEAIKVRLEDVDTLGENGGGSVKLMALTCEVGRKSGISRQPAARSIG